MKHSCGWRPGSGSLLPPSKGQELSVNIAACSNLLLINPINTSKVLHQEIHTKDTIPQYAIYGRMREDNPFTCSIYLSYFCNTSEGSGGHHFSFSAILGKAVPSSWLSNCHTAFRQKLTQRSSIWNMFNSFSEVFFNARCVGSKENLHNVTRQLTVVHYESSVGHLRFQQTRICELL